MWHHSGSESCHLDLHPQIHCCASIGSCACRRRRRRLFVVSRVPHEQILYLFAFASLLLHLLLVLLCSSRSISFLRVGRPACFFLLLTTILLSLSFLILRHHSRRLDGSAFGELRYCCEGELCMRRLSDGLTTAVCNSKIRRIESISNAKAKANFGCTGCLEASSSFTHLCRYTLEVVSTLIAEQLAIDVSQVQAESKFTDLGADSLDTVEIMMALEEKFDIQLGEDNAEQIVTVQHAADLIQEVVAAKEA